MKKRFLSMIIAFSIIVIVMPVVSATEVKVKLNNLNITDERLIEMLASGEIPKNVTHLDIANNQISDIAPLSELTKLERLNLLNNQISNITSLSVLVNLETLGLVGNQINDVLPIIELTNLQILALGNNQISDITPLITLKNLRSLDLSENQITDITPLSELTNLGGTYGNLSLDNNQISDISPLSKLTDLQYLIINNNQITDLTPLYPLKNLNQVTLQGNPVTDEQIDTLYKVLEKADFIGRVLTGEPKIEDAVEILKYTAGLTNKVSA